MANYSSVADIFATIENATAVRNNSKNDDGVDTVTGVDWFTYNGKVCSQIYVSGNMFIGLGANAEDLKINRRDGASYYVWREEGTLDNYFRFLRIRWQGYTRYNYSTSSYLQTFDVILWDTGDISLHMINIPTSYYDGTFTLGSLSYTKPTAASPDITFKLQEDNSYLVEYSMLDISRKQLCLDGSCEILVNGFPNITNFMSGFVNAQIELPEGTNVNMFLKANDGDFFEYENGANIQCFSVGSDITENSLTIKFDLHTVDEFVSPLISDIKVVMRDTTDENIVVLNLENGNIKSIQNAIGDVKIVYDGSGTLMGLGGPVAEFETTFSPVDLTYKENQNDAEHVDIVSVTPKPNLQRIFYTSVQTGEHVNVDSVNAKVILTKVDDI